MNLKNFIIGVAIFILTISVCIYGIGTIFGKLPDYNKFCPPINNELECRNFGGNWTNYSSGTPGPNIPLEKQAVIGGYCDIYSVCDSKFRGAREDYNKKVFLIALPAGIALIIIGALFFGLISVGGGLMAGGVGVVVYGILGFWEFADNWIKFILSLIGLGIIIWLAYYLNKRLVKKK